MTRLKYTLSSICITEYSQSVFLCGESIVASTTFFISKWEKKKNLLIHDSVSNFFYILYIFYTSDDNY